MTLVTTPDRRMHQFAEVIAQELTKAEEKAQAEQVTGRIHALKASLQKAEENSEKLEQQEHLAEHVEVEVPRVWRPLPTWDKEKEAV